MGPQKVSELLNGIDKELSGTAVHDKLAEAISSDRNARVKDKAALLYCAYAAASNSATRQSGDSQFY